MDDPVQPRPPSHPPMITSATRAPRTTARNLPHCQHGRSRPAQAIKPPSDDHIGTTQCHALRKPCTWPHEHRRTSGSTGDSQDVCGGLPPPSNCYASIPYPLFRCIYQCAKTEGVLIYDVCCTFLYRNLNMILSLFLPHFNRTEYKV
jgi:hypothetical protein